MTVKEAREIVKDFDENTVLSEEDIFLFTEAMNFLIEKEKNPRDMMHLGGYYYETRHFDLALKYYEMAAAMDYDPAYECLGYIWYYGRTGSRDFKKAFEYFTKMANKGDLVAQYKIADMYKNGYYVDKNYEIYVDMVENLYKKIRRCNNVFDPVPEICTRLARIRTEQGEVKQAINLYLRAKDWLAQRIQFNAFFGNLNIMKWLIDDLYELMEFDEDYFDFYDLYYLLKSPHKIHFMYQDQSFLLESVQEGDACHVCLNGKWYYNREDFFKDAQVDGKKLTALYRKLYDFKVVE